MAIRIVIENAYLRGSRDEHFLQRVATAYLDGREYRVLAPPKATGNPLEWLDHIQVRQLSESGQGENIISDGRSGAILEQLVGELKRSSLDAEIWKMGTNEDGRFYAAQICLQGHVQNSNGNDFERGEHCPQCGEACIDSCPTCKVAIRGNRTLETLRYNLPNFCHKCGKPYPWMRDRLQTARELLNHDDKLTEDEREKLWGLLRYVMSDPKSDMVPAKKKLIEFSLANALPATRDFILEFMAKYVAEMSKP